MDKQKKIINQVIEQGVLPLYFHPDVTVASEVLKALYAAGIRAVEFTNRGKEALDNFKALRELTDNELPGLYLGIGTIKNKKDAKAFIKAGADYIICPGLIPEVARITEEEEILWMPGCMTVTEIIEAEKLGAALIKLFPGNLLGPGFVSAIKELFPGLLFMPTGGVELEQVNLQAWFKSGVCAVGMGSKLITKQILESKDYTTITALTREAMGIIQTIR